MQTSLQTSVEQFVRTLPASARAAVSLSTREGQILVDLDGDTLYVAASTMKVFVAIALCRRIDAGELRLDQRVLLRNQFTSADQTTAFATRARADADPLVYQYIGAEVALRFLIERMICRSSNLATNVLFELTGPTRLAELVVDLGLIGTSVGRGIEDPSESDSLPRNRVTSRDLNNTMLALLNGTACSQEMSQYLVGCLLRQTFNAEIPALLPAGTQVAHKTGWLRSTHHDTGIIFPIESDPYILTVLTDGLHWDTEARSAIQIISAKIFDASRSG